MSDDAARLVSRLRRTAGEERVAAATLTALVRDVFSACGVPAEHAEIAAEVAVFAQLHGSDSHGAIHLPLYVRGLLDGTIKSTPEITYSGRLPCCSVMDADRALGLVSSRFAVDAATEKANQFGMGAIAVRNSSHFGTAGYYAARVAEQGLIGLAFTNAAPAIAPTGGRDALLGTNPIGAGFPIPGTDPIVIDMATAVVARSRIRHAITLGEKTIPEGWALDPEGRPTTDPNVAVKGSIQAIGGPKGYALALMVEILCSALSDGQPGYDVTYENMVKRPSGISHFFLVLNPDGFAGTERYGARVSHIADGIRNSRGIEGAQPRLPGARGHAIDRQSQAEGLAMFDNLRIALNSVARMLEPSSSSP